MDRGKQETAPAPRCGICGMLAFGKSGDDLEAAAFHEERYGHAPVAAATKQDA